MKYNYVISFSREGSPVIKGTNIYSNSENFIEIIEEFERTNPNSKLEGIVKKEL